jgi:quinol-cytochrome oxidoreductase complex cytochrome b subunit
MRELSLGALGSRVRDTALYRSIVRHGIADTNRNRSLVIFENLFLHVHPVKVREKTLRFSHTYWLGGITLACALVLIATGILLMFYYHPSVPQAYLDMKELAFVVENGTFLRNLHRWAAHLMVFAAFLHMIRVFYHHAYRPPRQFNWVVGVVLLLVTLLLSYTGYLLPWDQLAFWGVSVGTNMAKEAPLIGEQIRFLLLGGHVVSENALLRFYVLHCVVLPVVLLLLLSVHIWRVRKDGGVQGPPEKLEITERGEVP